MSIRTGDVGIGLSHVTMDGYGCLSDLLWRNWVDTRYDGQRLRYLDSIGWKCNEMDETGSNSF